MKKILLSVFVLFTSFFSHSVLADDFTCDNNANNPYLKNFNSLYDESGDFDASFESFTKSYHTEMNDAFNKGIADLSRSVYSGDSDEKACAPVQYKQENNASLAEFQLGMTQKYGVYKCALEAILSKKIEISKNVTTFSDGLNFMKNREYLILEEIRKSGLALTMTLQTYQEMRQWYPVHRDLECLISTVMLESISITVHHWFLTCYS